VHKKPLHEDEIGVICTEALHGLQYLHGLSRIHRDVKAGNILLSDNGVVKLGQFATAAAADVKTVNSMCSGVQVGFMCVCLHQIKSKTHL